MFRTLLFTAVIISSFPQDDAIIDGRSSIIYRAPFVVYIRAAHGGDLIQFTGIIVHPQFVLTSARYCNIEEEKIKVFVGRSDKRVGNPAISVIKRIVHDRYIHNRFTFSVCALHLNETLTLSTTTQVATLAEHNEPMPSRPTDKYVIFGWGLTSPGRELRNYPDLLQHGYSRITSHERCKYHYNHYLQIDNDLFCTGSDEEDMRQRTAKGDEGGPFFNIDNGKVYGMIVNYIDNYEYDQNPIPKLAAKISTWRRWLDDVIRNNEDLGKSEL